MFNSYQMYFTDNFTCRIIFPCVALCGLLMCVVGKKLNLLLDLCRVTVWGVSKMACRQRCAQRNWSWSWKQSSNIGK